MFVTKICAINNALLSQVVFKRGNYIKFLHLFATFLSNIIIRTGIAVYP